MHTSPRHLVAVCLVVAALLTTAQAPHRHGEPASQPAAAESSAAPNRDLHGPADVERYIHMLQRPERVKELQPDLVVKKLGLADTAHVADIGAGPGVIAIPLARHLSRGVVYAVDVEPRQLDALREHILKLGLDNIVPVLASYSDPHLPPGRMDLIFIADTYHHIDDRVAYFRGLREDLKPGGRLAILEYKPGDLPVGPPASHKVPVAQRHAELAEAGFTLLTTHSTHQYHDFEIWRAEQNE